MTRSLIRCYDPTLYAWCADFARRWPHYQQRDGTMNWSHILRAIEAEGFIEIARENVDAVKAALEARAARKAMPALPPDESGGKRTSAQYGLETNPVSEDTSFVLILPGKETTT